MSEPDCVIVPKPLGFSFLVTALGHGWHELAPFEFDEREQMLVRLEAPGDGGQLELRDADAGVAVNTASGAWSPAVKARVAEQVAEILAFDVDLAGFAEAVEGHDRYEWAVRVGFGRPLRAPTVWEDLAKTLLTTNTTWVVTRQMVARLCALGEPSIGAKHAFPSPERIASMSLEEFEASARAGYRTAYLHELATRIAKGEIDPESWRDPAIPSSDLFAQIRSLKGFGPYAAGAAMRLLARHDYLAIDTALRDVYRAQIADGTAATDADIATYYERFGPWKGLAAWADLMVVPLTAALRGVWLAVSG